MRWAAGSPAGTLDYFPGDDLLAPLERPCGLPLGNQTSQFFANVYLNGFDHFVKQQLGCRSYVRYVDDVVVLGDDRKTLWTVRDAMRDYLASHLRLRLHPTKQVVHPVTTGVNFVGYRIFPTHRRLRRSGVVRFTRTLRRLQRDFSAGEVDSKMVQQRIAGWIGHAQHADTYGLRAALFDQAVFSRA